MIRIKKQINIKKTGFLVGLLCFLFITLLSVNDVYAENEVWEDKHIQIESGEHIRISGSDINYIDIDYNGLSLPWHAGTMTGRVDNYDKTTNNLESDDFDGDNAFFNPYNVDIEIVVSGEAEDELEYNLYDKYESYSGLYKVDSDGTFHASDTGVAPLQYLIYENDNGMLKYEGDRAKSGEDNDGFSEEVVEGEIIFLSNYSIDEEETTAEYSKIEEGVIEEPEHEEAHYITMTDPQHGANVVEKPESIDFHINNVTSEPVEVLLNYSYSSTLYSNYSESVGDTLTASIDKSNLSEPGELNVITLEQADSGEEIQEYYFTILEDEDEKVDHALEDGAYYSFALPQLEKSLDGADHIGLELIDDRGFYIQSDTNIDTELKVTITNPAGEEIPTYENFYGKSGLSLSSHFFQDTGVYNVKIEDEAIEYLLFMQQFKVTEEHDPSEPIHSPGDDILEPDDEQGFWNSVLYYLELPWVMLGDIVDSFITVVYEVTEASKDLRGLFSGFMGWLPREVVGVISMGVTVGVLLRIVGR